MFLCIAMFVLKQDTRIYATLNSANFSSYMVFHRRIANAV